MTIVLGLQAGCAFMYYDDIDVHVEPRDLKDYPDWTGKYRVTQQWENNLTVTYDSRISDLRERRYGISIGKNVFDRYKRDWREAVSAITDSVVTQRKLCSKGWQLVNDRVNNTGVGGISWVVLCNA